MTDKTDKIGEILRRHDAQIAEARSRGRKYALRIKGSTDQNAALMSAMLETLTEKDPECGQLMIEWTFEMYWAHQLVPLLEPFEKCWQKLVDEGPKTWGDIDYTARAERAPNDDQQIVSLECHCAARDDNIHVFIHAPSEYGFGKFHVRTVGHRACKVWGNRFRSLAEMRRNDFKLEYGDCRDEGYGLSYEEFTRKVDRGYSMGGGVYWSIWHLRGLIGELLRDTD